ncbi:MAG: hypothetical protein IJZ36_02425 [Bacilli bacterium]|nr:hypothetical protein [Bacilli bacterium]
MEVNLNEARCIEILNKEKKETLFYCSLMFLVLGFTVYSVIALLTAVNNTEINSVLWFVILFVEVVLLLYFILKLREHIRPILVLRNLNQVKSFEVAILDVDMAWCFDTILFRPCSLMELSWKEEDSLAVIEWKKEKDVADVVRKALLIYKEENMVSAYVLNEYGTIL